MSELLTVVLAWLSEEGTARVADFQFRVQQMLGLEPNYLSLSVWRDCDLPERYAIVFHYLPDAQGRGMFEKVSRLAEFDQLVRAYQAPPDIHHMAVAYRHAAQAGNLQTGHMMSLSLRKAEPGYGDALGEEIADIFGNLRYIDGYLGSVYGPNRAIDEEIIALVYWASRRAFDKSIPAITPYEVKLFERIG